MVHTQSNRYFSRTVVYDLTSLEESSMPSPGGDLLRREIKKTKLYFPNRRRHATLLQIKYQRISKWNWKQMKFCYHCISSYSQMSLFQFKPQDSRYNRLWRWLAAVNIFPTPSWIYGLISDEFSPPPLLLVNSLQLTVLTLQLESNGLSRIPHSSPILPHSF